MCLIVRFPVETNLDRHDAPFRQVVKVLFIDGVLNDRHGHDSFQKRMPTNLRHSSIMRKVQIGEKYVLNQLSFFNLKVYFSYVKGSF